MIGAWDYPSERELAEDAYYDGLQSAERESFDAHYSDEIEGEGEYPGSPPEEIPSLVNAPGQLPFDFGAAY